MYSVRTDPHEWLTAAKILADYCGITQARQIQIDNAM